MLSYRFRDIDEWGENQNVQRRATYSDRCFVCGRLVTTAISVEQPRSIPRDFAAVQEYRDGRAFVPCECPDARDGLLLHTRCAAALAKRLIRDVTKFVTLYPSQAQAVTNYEPEPTFRDD